MSKDEDVTRFTLRVPDEIYKKLEERSRANRRSVHAEVLTLVERFLDSQELIVFEDSPKFHPKPARRADEEKGENPRA